MDEFLSYILDYFVEAIALVLSLVALYKSSRSEKISVQIDLLDRKREISHDVDEASRKIIYAIKLASKTSEYLESVFRIAGHQNISKEVIDVYTDMRKFKTEFLKRLEMLQEISNRIHRLDSITSYSVKKSHKLRVALEDMRISADSIIIEADKLYDAFEQIGPILDPQLEESLEYFREKYRRIEEIESRSGREFSENIEQD